MANLKKLLIFFFFFIVGILIAQKGILKVDNPSLLPGSNKEFTPTLDIWNEDIQKVKIPLTTKTQVKGVLVPKYWKYSINYENPDYLEGYIPNIRDFKEYWNLHNNLLYGINPYDYSYTLDEISQSIENGAQYHKAEGIENETEYFKWDSSQCKEIFSTRLNSYIFICDNWINWLSIELKDKGFVLVKCNLNQKDGYCIYTDYINTYYTSKNYGESRCFGENNLYCNYDKYLKIISLN
ncbi:MAG TPA: hypothetical protein P5059_01415 [Candidatus Dojkabacteria bacterium]|nr:hypothetical protein [Candidatus Dojkabacteria bacterium]